MKRLHRLDRAQLRLLADPLRQEILTLLCREALSTAQLAERMTRPPSNLYYHVNRLRKAGLIRVVRRQQVRGAVEVFHRAVAESFTAPPALLRTGHAAQSDVVAAVETMAQGVVARFADSAARGLIGGDAGRTMPMVTSLTVRTTPARMAKLRARLERCIRAFAEETAAAADAADTTMDARGDDVVEYALFDLLFPVRRASDAPRSSRSRTNRGR